MIAVVPNQCGLSDFQGRFDHIQVDIGKAFFTLILVEYHRRDDDQITFLIRQ